MRLVLRKPNALQEDEGIFAYSVRDDYSNDKALYEDLIVEIGLLI
jgi:hypothetical protein